MCAHTRGRGRGLMTASALKGTWTNTGRAGGQPTSTLLSRSSQKEEPGEDTVGVGKEN